MRLVPGCGLGEFSAPGEERLHAARAADGRGEEGSEEICYQETDTSQEKRDACWGSLASVPQPQ